MGNLCAVYTPDMMIDYHNLGELQGSKYDRGDMEVVIPANTIKWGMDEQIYQYVANRMVAAGGAKGFPYEIHTLEDLACYYFGEMGNPRLPWRYQKEKVFLLNVQNLNKSLRQHPGRTTGFTRKIMERKGGIEYTMHIRLSTLAENSASWLGLLAEWGLSILVETNGVTILVDTGRSMVAAHNARIMGAKIKSIDKILFSHGHEDHTGGLVDLLKLRDMSQTPVEVIAHPDAWAPKFWRSDDGSRYNYIGIPFARKLVESLGASFHLTPEPVWITDRIVTSGEIPMLTDFEEIDANARVETDDGYVHDPLRDDQSLFIKSDKGLIIVAGCAHRGIVNTIRRAQNLTGCDDVYAIVGGIHLFGAAERRVRLTLEEIKRLDVQRIGVSHCTGPSASAFLARELGDRFFFNHAGTVSEFDV